MSKLYAFTLLIAAVVLAGSPIAGSTPAEEDQPPSPGSAIALRFDEFIETGARSGTIQHPHDRVTSAVGLRRVMFHLQDGLHLTAQLMPAWFPWKSVDYEIHAAVFDSKGNLLGTARETLSISKAKISYGSVPRALFDYMELDFGRSRNYQNASHFAIVVSEPQVRPAADIDE